MVSDLKSKRAIYWKAILFVVIGAMSFGLLLAQKFDVQTLLLLCVLIWSCCRAYYFAFYVIERYVDPSFRFSGLTAFARYLLERNR
jgi:hypothetical protein